MNYLAHLALSNGDTEIMLGNFIGDYVKGNNFLRYSPKVRLGILLHRKIDDYTDKNDIVKESALLLRDSYGRYSGVIVDMFYDHFLASDWSTYYPDSSLHDFVSGVHKMLLLNYFRLPNDVKTMLPFLIKSRRLENYANFSGLSRALDIMARNTSLPCRTQDAMKCLHENYDIFKSHFESFYPQLRVYVDEELSSPSDIQSML